MYADHNSDPMYADAVVEMPAPPNGYLLVANPLRCLVAIAGSVQDVIA